MSVSLHKRSALLKNILLFIILTFLYLHVMISINSGTSALIYENLLEIYSAKLYLIYVGVITFYFVYLAKTIAKLLFGIFCCLYLYEGINLFFLNYNKIILIFNFIFLVTSFYFYLFLKLELEEAIYRPSFDRLDVGNINLHDVNVLIGGKFGEGIRGHITNWDTSGCFVQLDDYKSSFRGSIGVKIEFNGNEFFQRGDIVSSFSNGVGIKFKSDRRKRQKTAHDWLDFYAIIHDMGLKPREI